MKPNTPAERQPPSKGRDLIVFDIVRDSRCADCGKELLAHDFLFMEGERPLCLTCADLDELVYLHRGDTAPNTACSQAQYALGSRASIQQGAKAV